MVVALAAPGEAGAWTNTYCGVLISSWSWCGDGSNHTYDTNRGSYDGSGSVWVCQRLLYADTTTVRSGQSCAWNYVYKDYGSTTVTLFEAEVTHDSGSSRHTITGVAVA